MHLQAPEKARSIFTWASLKIKPAKSHKLSVRERARNNNITFLVNAEKIPVLVEHPVRSLSRLYTAGLSDKHVIATVTSQLVDSLNKNEQSYLPEKFKVWRYQHTLYQRVIWLLNKHQQTAKQLLPTGG